MTTSSTTSAVRPPSVASNLWVISGMILAAALFRALPSPEYRPPNMAPIGAMALFGGAVIADRRLAFAIPLLAMLISDLLIEFDSSRLWVYGSIALITLVGRALQTHRRQPLAIGTAPQDRPNPGVGKARRERHGRAVGFSGRAVRARPTKS